MFCLQSIYHFCFEWSVCFPCTSQDVNFGIVVRQFYACNVICYLFTYLNHRVKLLDMFFNLRNLPLRIPIIADSVQSPPLLTVILLSHDTRIWKSSVLFSVVELAVNYWHYLPLLHCFYFIYTLQLSLYKNKIRTFIWLVPFLSL